MQIIGTLCALFLLVGSSFAWATGPQRIVSLMPAYTEAVCLLGGCERLVGTDNYSDWPSQVLSLPKLGGLEDNSLEAIVRLKPDLVLSHPSGRLNARLKGLGLDVIELPSESLRDIEALLLTIETILTPNLSVPVSAKQLWRQTQHSIAKEKRAAYSTLKVYMEVDSALYAAGQTSYLGELLQQLGAVNVVPRQLGTFPKLSPEFVLRQDPTVIMQLHSATDVASDFSFAKRPGWQALQAVKMDKICRWTRAELNLLLRPGPRVDQAVKLMAACLRRAL